MRRPIRNFHSSAQQLVQHDPSGDVDGELADKYCLKLECRITLSELASLILILIRTTGPYFARPRR